MAYRLFLQINEYDHSPINLLWENELIELASCNRDILQKWIDKEKEYLKDWCDSLNHWGMFRGGPPSPPKEPNLIGNDGKLYKFTFNQKLYEHFASDDCEVIVCIN